MKALIYETMFKKLQKIGLIDQSGNLTFKDHIKLKNPPYMDLNVDNLLSPSPDEIRISMAHNFIQNGDVMADPDMEIRIYPKTGMIEALTYQLDSMGIYQRVYIDESRYYPALKKELNHFLNQWLTNIIDQGFKHEN